MEGEGEGEGLHIFFSTTLPITEMYVIVNIFKSLLVQQKQIRYLDIIANSFDVDACRLYTGRLTTKLDTGGCSWELGQRYEAGGAAVGEGVSTAGKHVENQSVSVTIFTAKAEPVNSDLDCRCRR